MADAEIEYLDNGTPYAPLYRDVYRSRSGAGQASLVFVEGNRVVDRLAETRRLAILETGFGLGLNLVATLRAAQALTGAVYLRYAAIELHPVAIDDLRRVHTPADPPAEALLASYLELLRTGAATVALGDITVDLELEIGDGAAALAALTGPFDALYLDGFAPSRNPGLWNQDVYEQLARLSHSRTTLSTYTVARPVRLGLAAAGFTVEKAPGFGDKLLRLGGSYGG